MQKKNNKQNGYTIIETMITVSIFIVVIMAGMGALLNANLIHQKSRDMRSILDNLSFIMEDMSKNLRTGYNYRCILSSETVDSTAVSKSPVTQSCPDGGRGIVFEQQDKDNKADNPTTPDNENTGDQWVYYRDTNPNDSSKFSIFKSTNGASSSIPLTPDEVNIELASFSVFGAKPPTYDSSGDLTLSSDKRQPFVTIRLVGKITYKNIETPFSLQTSVSQRKLDNISSLSQ